MVYSQIKFLNNQKICLAVLFLFIVDDGAKYFNIIYNKNGLNWFTFQKQEKFG